MKKFIIRYTNERLITPSGLSFVGAMVKNSGLVRECNRLTVSARRSQPQIKSGDILLSYIGLLCQGKTEFEGIKEMNADLDFFKMALGLKSGIPSPETLRQRMDYIGSSLRSTILRANVKMFQNYSMQPTPLDCGLIPVDIDVTPFDNSKTHKEGVSRTYKGYDGYAPMMAYIGTEGYALNMELREGKQHCQNHTPEFLEESLKLAHSMTNNQLLVRLDSGNDATVNMDLLINDGSWFIVKHKRRRNESEEMILNTVKKCCKNVSAPREGKTVYIGSDWQTIHYKADDKTEKELTLRLVYEVIERTIDKHGQINLIPDITINTFWTNLDWSDEAIIDSYHKHGESEQFHSEIKTDMDVERLPSGKFETNELVLELIIIAYNILRMIGQYSLKSKKRPAENKPVKRKRLRTVISTLIQFASHIVEHGRQTILSLGRSNIWRYVFGDIYDKFAMV